VFGVGKNWKWERKFVAELAALFLIINADCNDLRFSGGELIVISCQTGKLLSAKRSPVAPVEHEHDFGFPGVVFQCNVSSFRCWQAELWSGIANLWD
jgi:hypothetical protein